MHTIISRAATEEEREAFASRPTQRLVALGCLLLAVAGGGYAFASLPGLVVGVSAALILTSLIYFSPVQQRSRRRLAKDREEQLVEEIHVSQPQVVEIGAIGDNEPILAFDIGDDQILFLQGQWLRDAETYAAAPRIGDPWEEFLNGLPAPHSFPSTEFTVTRLPHSGDVLRIDVRGEYLAPRETVEALKPEYEFGMSEIFIGRLDEIAIVLASEHERRAAT